MNSFNLAGYLLGLFLVIAIVVSNVDRKNTGEKSSSIRKKILWDNEDNDQSVQLNCSENWLQFEYMCYFLSDYMLTIGQAIHACDRFPWPNSQLMFIGNVSQLFYAVHIMVKNNLSNLLFRIDESLVKSKKIQNISPEDRLSWKTIQSLQQRRDGNPPSIKLRSSLEFSLPNYEYCQRIHWNVTNEEFPVLILSITLESNEQICSLSNAENSIAYYHLCQYALDRCLNNTQCGSNGRCVNTPTNFTCQCSFLSDGQFCDEWSHKDIQILVAIFIGVITVIVTVETIRNGFLRGIRKIKNRNHPQPSLPPIPDPITESITTNPSETIDPSHESAVQQDENKKNVFYLTRSEEKLRRKFLLFFFVIFFGIFLKFPAIHSTSSILLQNINSSSDDHLTTIKQFILNTFFRLDNFIFLSVSISLIGIFSYLNRYEKRGVKEYRSTIVEPIKLLQVTDRWTTTSIIIIQMFEILEVLETTITNIDQSSQFGVFAQIFHRIFFVILIALRHYPTLASLQFQNPVVRVMIMMYFSISMIYLTFWESFEMHWLITILSPREHSHMEFHIGSFIHRLIGNLLRYLLIGYISSELFMRILFDWIYIGGKRGNRSIILHRPIDQYSFKAKPEENRFIRPEREQTQRNNSEEHWINIRQYLHRIYRWNSTFRFTTIVICTYTVAFIFLFHLTGTVILLYQHPMKNPIRYVKQLLEFLLNIELQEGQFQIEVIVAALLTMIIYGIQLFLSVKNFRRRIDEWYDEASKNPDLAKQFSKREIIRKSTQYPSYLLLYLLGGFFLCFHLILFFCLMISQVQWKGIGLSQGRLGYILPVLMVYFLQKMVIRWLHYVFDCLDKRDEKTMELRLNILDSILLYLKLISCAFIGIIASMIRLLISILANIIFMPRIDYSYLVEPMESLDSAHDSFEKFLRLEILGIHPHLLQFSRMTGPANPQGPIIGDEPPPEQLADRDANTENDNHHNNGSLNEQSQTNETNIAPEAMDTNGTANERGDSINDSLLINPLPTNDQ